MTENGNLSTKQVRAIAALLECRTVKEAAEKAQVGERTLYRWLKEERFRATLDEAAGEALAQAARRMQSVVGKGVETLDRVLDDPHAPDKLKVRATGVLFNGFPKILLAGLVIDKLNELQEAENGEIDFDA